MADANSPIESGSSSLIKSANSIISLAKEQLFSVFGLGSLTIPLSSLGIGLLNRSINFYIPKVILWMAGLTSSIHFLRQMKYMNN